MIVSASESCQPPRCQNRFTPFSVRAMLHSSCQCFGNGSTQFSSFRSWIDENDAYSARGSLDISLITGKAGKRVVLSCKHCQARRLSGGHGGERLESFVARKMLSIYGSTSCTRRPPHGAVSSAKDPR